jgi:carboxypeptidase Q
MQPHRVMSFCFLALLLSVLLSPSLAAEPVDSSAIAGIIDEGTHRSQVMETLSMITDVIGPRLTWSPGYDSAASWVARTLARWGVENVHREAWAPRGRGWSLERYSAHVTAPVVFPLLSYPKAWSPGTDGTVEGTVIHMEAQDDSTLATYAGKLAGAIVLLGNPVEITPDFTPRASRQSDSTLLALANAGPAGRRPRRADWRNRWLQRRIFEQRKLLLCQSEGVAAILTPSTTDLGILRVGEASVADHPDTPYAQRRSAYDPEAPHTVPQIVVAAEQYNRLTRILRTGTPVRMELSLAVQWTAADSGFNLIGEIPGTDLKDETVIIGAHLDSWHAGTGATDNASGVAVCMEAMRILKVRDLHPRRTIRIALWGGEEQGLYGSRDYVRRHLGERVAMADSSGDSTSTRWEYTYTPEGERFAGYFNYDNGAGRIRGVYMQGSEALRPIFRDWLAPFAEMGASTLTLRGTSSTDHTAFTALGLPGFQFIQDELEYDGTTWHTSMDVLDRVVEDDLRQSAIIMAAFAYSAATSAEPLPHLR